MAIIIISSIDEETRRELAESLAEKLGCPCVSRKEVVEEATRSGIPVGKLEVAVLKGTLPQERLARHKARYLSFVTAAVRDRTDGGDLVYHGRACHLLLRGISHVLRVRLLPDAERRLERVRRSLNLDYEKARDYLRSLDEDIANWVHQIHGVADDDPGHYDLMLNLETMSRENAVWAVYSVAQFPDFRPTQASMRRLDDLWLAAKAHDRLGRDERTATADFNVSAEDGRVIVTYIPSQANVAGDITAVLEGLAGAHEVVCTMAETNILWVAETFDPSSAIFAEITDLAERWGAGVEPLQLLLTSDPNAGEPSPAAEDGGHPVPAGAPVVPMEADPTGGIEDDVEHLPQRDDGGLAAIAEQLIDMGCFAGSHRVVGRPKDLVAAFDPGQKYSLVVIGELFASKGEESRLRLTRELAGFLGERVNMPIITGGDLQEKFRFGRRQLGNVVMFLAFTAVLYGAVFSFQEEILSFTGFPKGPAWHVAATLAVFVFTPVVAYLYGNATGLLLRLFKIE